MGLSTIEDDSREIKNETMTESGHEYEKGVKHACDNGIAKLPDKYIFPVSQRPHSRNIIGDIINYGSCNHNINLPIIDFAHLQGTNRSHTILSLAKACQDYGFFQVIISIGHPYFLINFQFLIIMNDIMI